MSVIKDTSGIKAKYNQIEVPILHGSKLQLHVKSKTVTDVVGKLHGVMVLPGVKNVTEIVI